MLILVAALYVIVPAVLALAACLWGQYATITIQEEEDVMTDPLRVFRDAMARKAVEALAMWQSTKSSVWYDAAMYYYARAEALNVACTS